MTHIGNPNHTEIANDPNLTPILGLSAFAPAVNNQNQLHITFNV